MIQAAGVDQLLLNALERLRLRHLRLAKCFVKGWGGARRKACALTALYVGDSKDRVDAKCAATLDTEHLRSLGLAEADFYEPWNRGSIPARRLLRVVDDEPTRRALGR